MRRRKFAKYSIGIGGSGLLISRFDFEQNAEESGRTMVIREFETGSDLNEKYDDFPTELLENPSPVDGPSIETSESEVIIYGFVRAESCERIGVKDRSYEEMTEKLVILVGEVGTDWGLPSAPCSPDATNEFYRLEIDMGSELQEIDARQEYFGTEFNTEKEVDISFTDL